MANPLPEALTTGTFGELFVQLRLLEYGVQAAPPLKDSGTDLVGFRGEAMRTIQVKTTTGALPAWPEDRRVYHVLAIVQLQGESGQVHYDRSRIFLVPKEDLTTLPRKWEALDRYEMNLAHVEALFR